MAVQMAGWGELKWKVEVEARRPRRKGGGRNFEPLMNANGR